ncbi:hypothetical protein [Yersinia kristensenii]|uniref:hypothetical protein n=1 Tax=Yersinia kristensenii TaxID=28152 RepID=UPI00092D08D8|nr:hypothetical protein [Yersinia kristensenii]
MLNIYYIPIEDLNDFGVTRALQNAISDSVAFMPILSALSRMSSQEFNRYMKGQLSYEYLRTKFDSETLKPTKDYFLIYFTYKDVKYEVEVFRKIYNGDFLFLTSSKVRKAGNWHSSLNGYSYRDYLAGKEIEKNRSWVSTFLTKISMKICYLLKV